MKKTDASGALEPYERILKRAQRKLALQIPIRLKLGTGTGLNDWFFDESDPKIVTLTCPPFRANCLPIFLHYLCTAKLLESGWPQVKTRTTLSKKSLEKLRHIPKAKRQFMVRYWTSRIMDSVLDFYAYRLVVQMFGIKHFQRFVRIVTAHDTPTLLAFLKTMHRDSPIPLSTYHFCLDWFASLFVLAGVFEPAAQKKLGDIFTSLLMQKDFRRITFRTIKRRIEEMRGFYRKLIERYPSYDLFLQHPGKSKALFLHYCKKAFARSGLIFSGFRSEN